MITVGSIDRATLAETFPFLAERFSGRRNADLYGTLADLEARELQG